MLILPHHIGNFHRKPNTNDKVWIVPWIMDLLFFFTFAFLTLSLSHKCVTISSFYNHLHFPNLILTSRLLDSGNRLLICIRERGHLGVETIRLSSFLLNELGDNAIAPHDGG